MLCGDLGFGAWIALSFLRFSLHSLMSLPSLSLSLFLPLALPTFLSLSRSYLPFVVSVASPRPVFFLPLVTFPFFPPCLSVCKLCIVSLFALVFSCFGASIGKALCPCITQLSSMLLCPSEIFLALAR